MTQRGNSVVKSYTYCAESVGFLLQTDFLSYLLYRYFLMIYVLCTVYKFMNIMQNTQSFVIRSVTTFFGVKIDFLTFPVPAICFLLESGQTVRRKQQRKKVT